MTIAEMLSGGHPNTVGRAWEVVDLLFAQPARLPELFDCYQSPDEVVRYRASRVLEDIAAERPDLLVPYLDRLISEVGALDQGSAQQTVARLFRMLSAAMTGTQIGAARLLLAHNLEHSDDWIVLNATMETLTAWAARDAELAAWLRPWLDYYAGDERRSVAQKAKEMLDQLQGGQAGRRR